MSGRSECPDCGGTLTRVIGCLDDGGFDEYICDNCGKTLTDYGQTIQGGHAADCEVATRLDPHWPAVISKADELLNTEDKLRNDRDRARYYHRLCYKFDKLPNARRHEASWWVICKPEICELCNIPLPEPEGAGWCKPHREAMGWSEQYRQF